VNDGSRPSAIALQEEVANHLKRLESKAPVVSVKEKVFNKISGEI
jgi:hypothetical protein